MGAIWSWFLGIIFSVLQFFYGWTHDYGFAIILLTLVFRLAMMPLTSKQTKSMYELQAIQPKIKALQEKYKNNKEKQQAEMMKFYQDNKVNPFGGCLPLLLQMPLFIALIGVLGGTLQKPGNLLAHLIAHPTISKAFWVVLPDITKTPQAVYVAAAKAGVLAGIWAALPYMIFVALFGLSVWLPQYLMTKDPMQRRTGTIMAVVMLYIGFIYPAGVLIYWVTSSGWQVVQQVLMQRKLERAKGAEA